MMFPECEAFQRLLFEEAPNGGTNAYVTSNEFDKSEAIVHNEPNVDPFQFSCLYFLKNFIRVPIYKCETFVLEMSENDEKEQLKIIEKMHSIIGNVNGFEARINIDRLVVNQKIKKSVINLAKALIFNFNGKVKTEIHEFRIGLELSEDLFDFTCEQLLEMTGNGDTHRHIKFSTNDADYLAKMKELTTGSDGLTTLRFAKSNRFEKIFSDLDGESQPFNRKVRTKQVVDPATNLLVLINKSDCGIWIHCLKTENLKKFENIFKTETCGSGNFCKTCAPLEVFQTSLLINRFYSDPEWLVPMIRPEEKLKALEFEKMAEIIGKLVREDHRDHEAKEKKEEAASTPSEPQESMARVRFSIKENKCLLVIQKDFSHFLRSGFHQHEKNVRVFHMENSSDLKNAETFTFRNTSHLQLACKVLKDALIRSKMLIETFELELGTQNKEEQEELVQKIKECLKKVKGSENQFRAKKLIFNWKMHPNAVVMAKFLLFKTEEIEELVVLKLANGTGSLESYEVMKDVPEQGKVEERSTTISTLGNRGIGFFKNLVSQSKGLTTLSHSNRSAKLFDEQVVSAKRTNAQVETKRFVDQQLVIRFNKSPCGVWIHFVKLENESKFDQFFKTETCGLRYFCKKHSNPVDYSFYQHLSRRVNEEPDWCDVVWDSDGLSDSLKNEQNLKKDTDKKEDLEKKKLCCWSGMPLKIKQVVIKKLDFMSRHAMRYVSHSDREAVDSTDRYVPRVRFGLQGDIIMIMFYTGIEKFFRMEITRGKQGVNISKLENTYNLKKASTKFIPNTAILPMAISILKSLFLHKSILIGTLEIQYFTENEMFQYLSTGCILQCMGTVQNGIVTGNFFRVKRFVANHWISPHLKQHLASLLCDISILEESDTEWNEMAYEKDKYQLSHAHINIIDSGLKISNITNLIVDDNTFVRLANIMANEKGVGYGMVRFREMDNFVVGSDFVQDMGPYSKHVNDKIQLAVRFYNMKTEMVIRVHLMKTCGFWAYMMSKDHEEKFIKDFEKESCCLRHFCDWCSDPFEYWFHNEMAWRPYNEELWTTGFVSNRKDISGKSHDEISKKTRENFKQKLEGMRKKGLGKRIGCGKSWGFTKMSNPDEDSDIEYHKMLKFEIRFSGVGDRGQL
ncbi:unnamed protein product [Caenorhabditis nigoni]